MDEHSQCQDRFKGLCVRACLCACVRARACVYVCVRARVRVRDASVCVHASVCMRVYVRVYMCMRLTRNMFDLPGGATVV